MNYIFIHRGKIFFTNFYFIPNILGIIRITQAFYPYIKINYALCTIPKCVKKIVICMENEYPLKAVIILRYSRYALALHNNGHCTE